MENTQRDCCICGNKDSLLQVHEEWICEKCLDIGNEIRTSLWKDSIEQLMKEYSEACSKCLSSDDSEAIHQVRILGRKIRSVLQFIGVSKRHALLLSIRKVHQNLNKIREVDVFLDEIIKQDEKNKVNADMIKLLTEKQKELREQLKEIIPTLINKSFSARFKKFANREMISYVIQFDKEKALRQYVEQFNQLVEQYDHSATENGKTSGETIKILHSVRKRAKSLRYTYNYLDEIFGEKYLDDELYYKNLQSQFGKIKDLEDWLKLIKTFEKELSASKKVIKEVKGNLKRRLKNLIDKIELHPVPAHEG